jgi:hypothetical protein
VTSGWWRRNVVALVALVILLPVTVGVIALNEWSQFDQGHPTKPISVDPGDDVIYGGARIGPAKSEFTDNVLAPADTRVVHAVLLVTPGAGPISCSLPTLREAGGAQRQWAEASADLDIPYDPESHTVCDSDLPIRYSLTVDYLVPDDAVGPFVLEFTVAEEVPRYLQLLIEP